MQRYKNVIKTLDIKQKQKNETGFFNSIPAPSTALGAKLFKSPIVSSPYIV